MIVVTGATGFLGGAVVRALLARGEAVKALVRPSSSAAALDVPGVSVAYGDVASAEGLREAFDGARMVVHAAGMLGQPGVPDATYVRVHATGTANVLAAARAAGVVRVVHVSSPGVLGPLRRGAPDADEEAPLRPTNPYERSKAAAEDVVRADAEKHGPIAVVVRPEFVYGPHDRHVLRLFEAVARGRFVYFGAGDAVCHPTFIDDAVAGLLSAAERGTPGRIYHVAGPRPVSIVELAGTYAAALGVRAPFVHVPERPVRWALRVLEPVASRARLSLPISTPAVDFFTQDRHFSVRRARDELGFVPSVDLEDGVRRTVRWYEREGLLPSR
ncbi:MAG TPA: NAD-dependent epimerase/dehydratase family protein [Polyangiaceae bacterium]